MPKLFGHLVKICLVSVRCSKPTRTATEVAYTVVGFLHADGSAASGDALGLGYGSSSDSEDEDGASTAAPQPEAADEGEPAAAIKNEAAVKEEAGAVDKQGVDDAEQAPEQGVSTARGAVQDGAGRGTGFSHAAGPPGDVAVKAEEEAGRPGSRPARTFAPKEIGGGAPAVDVPSDNSKSSIIKGSRWVAPLLVRWQTSQQTLLSPTRLCCLNNPPFFPFQVL